MPSATIYCIPDGLVADANLGTGAGTDNSAAIQTAINTGLPVVMPPGLYKVSTTLQMNPAVGLSLGGTFAGHLGPDDTSHGSWLVWGGAAAGTLINLRGIKSRVHDLGLCAADTKSLDRCVDVEKPAVYPNLSSQHLFHNVFCEGRRGPVRAGWVVGEDGALNNEFHAWKACVTKYCTYAGVSVPNATRQAKNLVFEDCSFQGSGGFTDHGVIFNSGSADFVHCNFDSLGIAINWFGAANEPVNMIGCTGETNRQWFDGTGVVYANLIGCRISTNGAANPQVVGQEFLRGGANWSIIGCDFEDTMDHYFRPNDGASVAVQSCQFSRSEPFPADDTTRFRLHVAATRVGTDNLLMDGGNYWAHNVAGVANGGGGVLLWDGRWPLRGTFAGGTYLPAFGEGRLYIDGAGDMWLKVGTNPPKKITMV